MIVEISKNVDKEIEKTPTYIQLKAAEQVETPSTMEINHYLTAIRCRSKLLLC